MPNHNLHQKKFITFGFFPNYVTIKIQINFGEENEICFIENGKLSKIIAMAGNRTRINCLEGSYADHYTTIAT